MASAGIEEEGEEAEEAEAGEAVCSGVQAVKVHSGGEVEVDFFSPCLTFIYMHLSFFRYIFLSFHFPFMASFQLPVHSSYYK